MKFITEEQLQSVLSEQLDLPIVDIHQKFNPKAGRILPRYLCKKTMFSHSALTIIIY